MTDEQSPAPQSPRPMSDADRKNWAMAAHLSALIAFVGIPSLIGPLVVWLVKKDSDAYVTAHSVHALNFNISVLIYTIAGSIALGVIGIATLGIGFLLAIPAVIIALIVWLVLVIQGGLAASRGEQFRYPMTIDFVK
ncbi:MAG: DUF4870 domain-containing protein [Acidimicrobiia bacterium]